MPQLPTKTRAAAATNRPGMARAEGESDAATHGCAAMIRPLPGLLIVKPSQSSPARNRRALPTRLRVRVGGPDADQRPKTIIGLLVDRVNRHSAHTAREQHLVDIADESISLGVVDLGAVSEIGVLVG